MKALIVVDIQNDFCPGGNLAVKDGDKIIPFVNQLMVSGEYDLIVATQDSHPKNHKSFASNNGKQIGELSTLGGLPQVMWPDHCVKGSSGWNFHSQIKSSLFKKVFEKGTNPEIDSYSGFFDNDKKSATGLDQFLKDHKIKEIDVVGLALDYCVKATAIDGASLGFKTTVLLQGTKAVNLKENDFLLAITELISHGVKVV